MDNWEQTKRREGQLWRCQIPVQQMRKVYYIRMMRLPSHRELNRPPLITSQTTVWSPVFIPILLLSIKMPLAVSYSTDSPKKNKRNMTKKGSEMHLRDSCKWCSVDNCQKTPQCWLPCKPDMAVTTVTGGGWGYKLGRMEYFRVTKRTRGGKKDLNSQTRVTFACRIVVEKDLFFFDSFWKPSLSKKWRGSSPGSPNRTLEATGLRGERWDPSILTRHWDLLSKLLNI